MTSLDFNVETRDTSHWHDSESESVRVARSRPTPAGVWATGRGATRPGRPTPDTQAASHGEAAWATHGIRVRRLSCQERHGSIMIIAAGVTSPTQWHTVGASSSSHEPGPASAAPRARRLRSPGPAASDDVSSTVTVPVTSHCTLAVAIRVRVMMTPASVTAAAGARAGAALEAWASTAAYPGRQWSSRIIFTSHRHRDWQSYDRGRGRRGRARR